MPDTNRKDPERARNLPDGMNFRTFSVRLAEDGTPASLDEKTRSVETVVTTEDPVLVWDWERWEPVREVLLMSGCELPKSRQVVLLDTHWRGGVVSVLGSTRNLRVEGDQLVGRNFFTTAEEGEAAWIRTREGHLTDCSAGYEPLEAEWIPEGETATIQGRKFQGPMKVVTRWKLKENSACPIGADERAKTRAADMQPQPSQKEKHIMAEEIKTPETSSVAPEARTAAPATTAPTVDAAAIEQRERTRCREIDAIATQFGHIGGIQDLRRQFIDSGKPVDGFRAAVMERMGAKPVDLPEPKNLLSEREAQRYSYRAALAAALAISEGHHPGKSFELEVSNEIRSSMPSNFRSQGGLMVPYQMMGTRAGLDATNSTKGPEVVFDRPGGFIEMLRNVSFALAMGAKLMTGLQGPVTFSRQTGAGTAYWMGENAGSNATESNMLLGTVPLAPKTLQSTTSYSRQLVAQDSFDIENLVRLDLAAIHGLAWDRAVAHGTGANNQPTGIYYADDVNAKAAGGAPDYDDLIDMITEVAKDNAVLGSLGWATTPGMAGKLLKTSIEAATNAAKIWTGKITDGEVCGYKAMATNQILATLGDGENEHGLIFGNWADVLIGTWGQGVELVVDPYALKKQGMIEVTSFQMCDIALRHPESFCKATGATI